MLRCFMPQDIDGIRKSQSLLLFPYDFRDVLTRRVGSSVLPS